MKILLNLFILTFLFCGKLTAQESKPELSVMFYNTENFFDVENDTTLKDDEYLRTAERRWTPARFRQKAERLAKVIVAAGKWNAPAIVGLCEIENREVLEFLCKTEPLAKFHYKIIQKDSPDPRGIDVALLYRSDVFRPLDYEAIPVTDPENKAFKTRDILKVKGILFGCDTVTFFVNHWPSRYGGLMETKRIRQIASNTLKKSVENTVRNNKAIKIICMGDFNDTPTDESMQHLVESGKAFDSGNRWLVNLSKSWITDDIQTIKSRFRWEVFDQFVVSQNVLDTESGCKLKIAEIYKGQFLLENDLKYGGLKPKRTYVGFKYNDGFSDHLPIILRLEIVPH
jgi:Predicted extracellular nuclease